MRTAAAFILAVLASGVHAQVPPKVGYQGRVLKSDGSPESGVVSMTFALYDAATGGATLGCDAAQVALSDGYYSVLLGGVGGCPFGLSAIPMSVFDGKDLYLELGIGGTLLMPRQRVASVPYAQRAGTAANVRGGTVEATSAQIGGASGVSITSTGISVGTNSAVDASGKATVATGSGLTGNGTTASPLAVVYGIAAATAAEGNDPRLSDARPPTSGSTNYIQNLGAAATPQTASYNIDGSAAVGGSISVGATSAATGTRIDVRGVARLGANTNQQALGALNVSAGEGAATTYRDIDMHGSWAGGEGHAITATHAAGTTNIVGQIVFQHDNPGSRIKFGRLYHAGDQSTYPIEMVSNGANANLSVAGGVTAAALCLAGTCRSRHPRVILTGDPRGGCPPAQAANTDLISQSVTLANPGFVLILADIISLAVGRRDLYLFVDGSNVSHSLDRTEVTDWQDHHILYATSLTAATHTIAIQGTIANAFGCGSGWGHLTTLVFE